MVVFDINDNIGESLLLSYTREIKCDVKQKETIKERTNNEMREKYLHFFFLMILHDRMLNYSINYPAKRNWVIFNK